MRLGPTILTLALAATAPLCAAAQEPKARFSVEEFFQRRDANGDGRLTPDEYPQADSFKVFDRNGDGAITREEAQARFAPRMGAGRAAAPAPEPLAAAPLPAAASQPPGDAAPQPYAEQAARAGLKPEVLAKIDGELQRHVAAENAAGLVALIHRRGVRGYLAVCGSSTLEGDLPMREDHIFRWGGLSRAVVAAAALVLADAGAFGLDEPIGGRCPEWAEPLVLESGALVPARAAVTPRRLMAFACGLAAAGAEDASADPAEVRGAAALRLEPGTGSTLQEYSETLARQPLAFHPGSGFSRGPEFDVLGRFLEAVAGKPLDEVVRERVLQPLGMADTDFWVPPEKSGRLCKASRPYASKILAGRDDDAFTHKPAFLRVSRGLCGTAGDLERFCRMLLGRGQLEGARVLKPETADLLYPLTPPASPEAPRGLSGLFDDAAGAWGGGSAQLALDRQAQFAALYLAQAQPYRASAFPAFRALAEEAAGLASGHAWTGDAADDGSGGAVRQRDRNGDGALSRAEFPAPDFDRIDVNRDNAVTASELQAFWKRN